MKNLLLSIVGGFALSGCVGVLHTNESVQQETDSNWDLYSDTWKNDHVQCSYRQK